MTLRKPKSSQSPRNARHKSEYIQTLNKVLDVAKLALAAFLLLYAYFEARNKQEKPVEVAPQVIEQPLPQVAPPVVPEKPEQAKKKARPSRRKPNRQGNDARTPYPR
jgi:hypothetical protein